MSMIQLQYGIMEGVAMMTIGGAIMARLRIRELAEQQGLNMSQLQRQTGLTMTMIRRYWYNTADGKEQGPTLAEVRLNALDILADMFKLSPGDLFERNQIENKVK